MSITAAELKPWLAQNNPENDAANAGGAIQDDTHANGGLSPEIADLASPDTLIAVSSAAGDTRTLTITVRNVTGTIVAQALPLQSATPVAFSANTAERIEKVELSAKDGTHTVTITRATGGALICTLPPNVVKKARIFYDAASGGSQIDRYEGHYFKNQNATLSLNAAGATLTVDALDHLMFAIAPAKGTQGPWVRTTGPGGGFTFVNDGNRQTVPTGFLAAGEAIFLCLRQRLAANAGAYKDGWSTQIDGTTT